MAGNMDKNNIKMVYRIIKVLETTKSHIGLINLMVGLFYSQQAIAGRI